MKTSFLSFCLFFIFTSSMAAQCHKSYAANHRPHHQNTKVSNDIIDLASGTSSLSTLVTAVKTADLVSTLQSEGPFTVFAPTNTAFAKLPQGTVATLLKPENKSDLQKVLTYHVISGNFTAKDFVTAIQSSDGAFEVETVAGGRLTARLQGETVLLDDEQGRTVAVTQTDVKASNGVVHIIDGVVLP